MELDGKCSSSSSLPFVSTNKITSKKERERESSSSSCEWINENKDGQKEKRKIFTSNPRARDISMMPAR